MAEYDDDDRGDRRDVTAIARQKVSGPATFLIISGFVMLLALAANIAVVASGYDVQVAMLEFFEGVAEGPQKADIQKEVVKAKNRDKTAEMIQNAVGIVLGGVIDLVILIGGFRMKGLRSYGLAMTAAILAIIPCNSCCLIGLPAGIWAVVALSNADVKAGFQAASGRVRRNDRDRDDRDRDDRDRDYPEDDRR
jgi:hypothetical protein